MKETSKYIYSNFASGPSPDATRADTNFDKIIDAGSKAGNVFDAIDRALNPEKYSGQAPQQPAPPAEPQKSGFGWINAAFLTAAGVTAILAGKSFYEEKIKKDT